MLVEPKPRVTCSIKPLAETLREQLAARYEVADTPYGANPYIEPTLLEHLVWCARQYPQAIRHPDPQWGFDRLWRCALGRRAWEYDLSWPPHPTPDQALLEAIVLAAIAQGSLIPATVLYDALMMLGRVDEAESLDLQGRFAQIRQAEGAAAVVVAVCTSGAGCAVVGGVVVAGVTCGLIEWCRKNVLEPGGAWIDCNVFDGFFGSDCDEGEKPKRVPWDTRVDPGDDPSETASPSTDGESAPPPPPPPPDIGNVPPTDQAQHDEGVASGTVTATSATDINPGWSIQIIYSDCWEELREGGSAAWRNNNPGNIRCGDFATNHGAIGCDYLGRAIFGTFDIGFNALLARLESPDPPLPHLQPYSELTIAAAINQWCPLSDGCDQEGYRYKVQLALAPLGVDINTAIVGELNSEQITVLGRAMYEVENGGMPEGKPSLVFVPCVDV